MSLLLFISQFSIRQTVDLPVDPPIDPEPTDEWTVSTGIWNNSAFWNNTAIYKNEP